MKRIYFLVIILIGLLCTASRCKDDCHKKIIFVNNSSKDVYIHSGNYPDTLGFCSLFPNPNRNPHAYSVKSSESNDNAAGLGRRDCIEADVAQGRIFVYVFDAEVLANYSWDDVSRDYMVLKTYHPTLEEMESNNWTIYFTDESFK